MTYIYDITLNFNEIFYDFFEWNNSDYLFHIKKIPIIQIGKSDFDNLFNNNVELLEDTYNLIKNKTEVYGKKDKKLSCVVIKCDNNLFALKLDENGITTDISSILVEEELDILEVKTVITKKFLYRLLDKREKMDSTRNEKKNITFLQNQIDKLSLNKDDDKIKYLYFEYFGTMPENSKKALKILKDEIKNNNHLENLKNFFIITSNKQ